MTVKLKNKLTHLLLLAAICLSSLTSFGQDKPAYVIYDQEGKQLTYSDMVESLAKTDITLFGELHNSPISHWLQLQVTQDLYKEKKENLYLGGEMWESDGQLIINEYLGSAISKKSFLAEARLWPNYETDYEPLLEFAKENGLPFVATNIPRRYAKMVFKGGLEALENLGKESMGYMAPMPIEVDMELESYKAMLEMDMDHVNENFPKAQAVKDATMAHFISRFWKKGVYFIHYNGAYHSDHHEGIEWYLKKYVPKAGVMTISTVQQDDISVLEEEYKAKADFIICTPSDMTPTH
jgi:uncharacterized iron-regulated protein